MPSLLLWAGFAGLSILPGAWIACLWLHHDARPLDRLACAIACSPPVLGIQFHLARWTGFEASAVAHVLLLVNLPALFLVFRTFRSAHRITPRSAPTGLAALLAFAPAAALVIVPCVLLQDHAFWSHTLMHVDVIQQIGRGALIPEEADLAGLRLGYPWLVHIHQALLSHWLALPASTAFLATNLMLLLASVYAAAATVRVFAGTWKGQLASAWFLLFALNAVGFTLGRILGPEFVKTVPVFGDWRYTPWLWTFRYLCPMPYALALVTMLMLGIARGLRDARSEHQETLALVFFVLSIGMLYAILLPVVALFLAGAMLARQRADKDQRTPLRSVVELAAGCAVAALLSHLFLQFVTRDRGPAAIELSTWRRMGAKGLESTLVAFPYLLFLPKVLGRSWRERSAGELFLAFSIPLGLVGYVLLHLPFHANEYKFVYATAPFLAVVVGLGVSRGFDTWGFGKRAAVIAFSLTCPFVTVWKLANVWPEHTSAIVNHEADHLTLAPTEPLAAVCSAIRTETPGDSLLLADRAEHYLPAFSERSLYAPLHEDHPHRGINLGMLYLLRDVKGYSAAIIDRRIDNRDLLFAPKTSDAERGKALAEVFELGRPAVFVLSRARHDTLRAWLARRPDARTIHEDERFTVVLVEAP